MPLFDTRCTTCSNVTENVYHAADAQCPPCEQCGGATEHYWAVPSKVEIFPAGEFEHAAGPDGRIPRFESRQKYKSYLREMGMYADLVEGR